MSPEFKSEFEQGVRAFAAVSPGTVAWGTMTDVALAQSGMDFWREQGYLLGTGISFWVVWTLCTLAGLLGPQYIPTSWGLGFTGILSLLAILCNLMSSRLQVLATAVAGIFATLVYSLPLLALRDCGLGVRRVKCADALVFLFGALTCIGYLADSSTKCAE